jgi:hypothetical protein
MFWIRGAGGRIGDGLAGERRMGVEGVVRCRHFRAPVSSEKMLADQWVGVVLTTFDDIFAIVAVGRWFVCKGIGGLHGVVLTTSGPVSDDTSTIS